MIRVMRWYRKGPRTRASKIAWLGVSLGFNMTSHLKLTRFVPRVIVVTVFEANVVERNSPYLDEGQRNLKSAQPHQSMSLR